MQWERPTAIFAKTALTARGWESDVLVTIGSDGLVEQIAASSSAKAGTPTFDILIPGMGNVHTHSFQRAMAGLTETASASGKDNFWSWREVMYRFALKLNPEQIEIIARHLYIELLKHGYTAVAEFHYMHHDTNGAAYADPAETSRRIMAAAQRTGIHLTLLPVLYETGNVGGAPSESMQRRFLHAPDAYLHLLSLLGDTAGDTVLGIAPHSLRAVKQESLERLLTALPALGLDHCPIHIHAAEQVKEVEDCLAAYGKRPVEWLLDNMNIDKRWCLIHATHMTDKETKALAACRAVAGLCPTTEVNLGDGIFPARDYLAAKGAMAIGTDSNVSVNPFAELRMLEYAQRLQRKQRNVLATGAATSTGRTLFDAAATGSAQALGIHSGRLEKGCRADLVALSADHALLADKKGDQILDTLTFAIDRPPVTDVFVNGAHVIKDGYHAAEEQSERAFRAVLSTLN